MLKTFALREWTIAAAIAFGIGGLLLVWLLVGIFPENALWLSVPAVIAYAATGAFAWWILLRRGFELSVWRGIAIGFLVGLVALPVFWLTATNFYFLLGRKVPLVERVVTPVEAIVLLIPVTLIGWAGIGWASGAMSAFAGGVLAYIKVRSLREASTKSRFARGLNTAGVVLAMVGIFILVLGFVPVSNVDLSAQPHPVNDYAAAIAQLEKIQADDLSRNIVPDCKTHWMTHGQKTDKVIVFFHGLSNCPAQFDPLGKQFYDLGYNVVIARFPEHVDISRNPGHMTPTAEQFREMADMTIDAAHGLGSRVFVLGLSGGGSVAAWAAQYRDDVERAVVVAPFFGLGVLPGWLNQWATNVIVRLPNIPFPAPSPVPYQYLGMSSMGVGESMRFADAPREASENNAMRAVSAVLVTNENDFVVSNSMARQVLHAWQTHGGQATEFVVDAKYGLPHDVIDIHQVGANPELVYPMMIDLVEGRTPAMP